MSANVQIEAGICGFRTKVAATSEDRQNVSFVVETNCENIRRLSEKLRALGPIDAYMETHPAMPSQLLGVAREVLVGSCAGCAVPVGLFKCMQVAAGIALPKDVVLRISTDV